MALRTGYAETAAHAVLFFICGRSFETPEEAKEHLATAFFNAVVATYLNPTADDVMCALAKYNTTTNDGFGYELDELLCWECCSPAIVFSGAFAVEDVAVIDEAAEVVLFKSIRLDWVDAKFQMLAKKLIEA